MKRLHVKRSLILLLGVAIGFGGLSACSTLSDISGQQNSLSTETSDPIDVGDETAFPGLIEIVSDSWVIYIGETHDRFDHHLNQLAVITGLHTRGVDFAIGLEFFPRPSQQHLDQYVAGEINEKTLLKQTGYYENWGYDFRLYRPILEYARDKGIALVALNAPAELVSQVSKNGLEGVSEALRSQLPEIQIPPDASYKRRMQRVFAMHPHAEKQFNNFLQVQLLWDEYMAESVASHLLEHPGRQLVVLAGSGHVAADSGIPQRAQHRIPHEYNVLISTDAESGDMTGADHKLLAKGDELPTSGKLGITIRESGSGVTVERWLRDRIAGEYKEVRPGDLITFIAGERIDSIEDVRLAMLDRLPGEQVWVELERIMGSGEQIRMTTVIELI